MIVRQGLRLLIEADGDIEIVMGEARTGREAVVLARTLRPEVIVMDIAMPLLNGLQATQNQALTVAGNLQVSVVLDDEFPEFSRQGVDIMCHSRL